ncbi:hypothetical protein FKW77_009784 [Venturia effusa]|uniref:Uncharacterized protein n=1 Tax=Venturia effusa TaxID=50376 RepID=A0A517LEQ4_9PEZI|nr:hypothetical protein FKW77_009784 [Venturia effusa]
MAGSLIEQCLRTIMSQLAAGSDDLIGRFIKFEPEEQGLLLRHIGNEIANLKSKENELQLIRSLMPTTDFQIHTVLTPVDSNDAETDLDLLWRDDVLSKWKYYSPYYPWLLTSLTTLV